MIIIKKIIIIVGFLKKFSLKPTTTEHIVDELTDLAG